MKRTKFTFKQDLLSHAIALLVRAINLTLKWKKIGLENSQGAHWSTGEPIILAFWHNQQIFMPWVYRNSNPKKKNIYALASSHGDGRLAAALMDKLGVLSISGSSSKGGTSALLRMIDTLESGYHIAITPDGPRGPAQKAKLGVVKLAAKTNVKILPAALDAKRKWEFRSWDKMFIPKPFSKMCLKVGEPISIPTELDRKTLVDETKKLSLAINQLNKEVSEELLKS